jgi:hypothetical protein
MGKNINVLPVPCVRLDVLRVLRLHHLLSIEAPMAWVNYTFMDTKRWTHNDILINLIFTFVRPEYFIILVEDTNEFVVAVDIFIMRAWRRCSSLPISST